MLDLMISQLYNSEGLLAYLLVFILAAIPLIEILIVIPIAIGIGLDPFTVALSAFIGNLIPVYLIIIAYSKMNSFRERFNSEVECEQVNISGRKKKAREVWNKYGVPGLSIISPGITGTHLATVMALGFGARMTVLGIWMCLSLLLWTILITTISFYGFEIIT